MQDPEYYADSETLKKLGYESFAQERDAAKLDSDAEERARYEGNRHERRKAEAKGDRETMKVVRALRAAIEGWG